MKEFLKKYKPFIALAIIVVFVGVFSYWGIFCLIKNIKSNADKEQSDKIDGEISQKRFSRIPQMKKTFKDLEENDKKVEGVLKEEEEVSFIKELETLAEETKNKIDLKIVEENQGEISKTKNKNDSKIKLPNKNFISLQANLTGNYANLYNFIKKLENFRYLVNIISINMLTERDETEKIVRVSASPFSSLKKGDLSLDVKNEPKLLLKTQLNMIVYTNEQK